MNVGKLMGASAFMAIAASVCCITPVLALLAGSGSIAAGFSWIAPVRPYMIGVTIALLGFSWYQKVKPQPVDDCGCAIDEKPTFIQSKTFLTVITVFVALVLALPYYSHIFFPKNEKQIVIIDKSDLLTAEFKISGMNCQACEEEIKHEVNKLNGITKVEVSYEEGAARIQFDKSKSNIEEITKAINSTGYRVTKKKLKNDPL